MAFEQISIVIRIPLHAVCSLIDKPEVMFPNSLF